MDVTRIKHGRGYLYATPDNYLWSRSRVNGNLMYVCCATEHCLGKGKININALQLTVTTDHSRHSDCTPDIRRLTISAECIARATHELTAPRVIFDEECRRNPGGELLSFNEIEAAMHKARRRVTPPLPATVSELAVRIIDLPYCKIEGLPFFRGYIDAGNYGEALLLGSDGQLDLLRRNGQFLHIDGTFWVVPALFRQLFSLFVKISGKVFPVLFVLMTRKTQELYTRVFRMLLDLIPEWRPTNVMSDYEDAPINALRAVFGDSIQPTGCWFHYSQAIYRRLVRLGLTLAYREQEAVRSMCRSLMVLPMLPPDDIGPALATLTVEAASITDATGTAIPEMNYLCAYVQRQWVDKATIGPDRMSVWRQQDRTNNAVERFHGQLRQTFNAHDSTWRFLEKLQHVAIAKMADAVRLCNGHRMGRPQTTAMRCHQRAIADAWNQYDRTDGQLTPVDFLRRVSHQLVPRFDQLIINRDDERIDDEVDTASQPNLVPGLRPQGALVPVLAQNFAATHGARVPAALTRLPIPAASPRVPIRQAQPVVATVTTAPMVRVLARPTVTLSQRANLAVPPVMATATTPTIRRINEGISTAVVGTRALNVASAVVASRALNVSSAVVATRSLNIAPSIVAARSFNVASTVIATRSLNIAPSIVAARSGNVASTVVATRSLNVAPSVVASRSGNVASTVIATRSLNVAPSVVATRSLNIAPSIVAARSGNVASTVVATRSLNVAPSVVASRSGNVASTVIATRSLNIAPSIVAARSVNVPSTVIATRSLNVAPSIVASRSGNVASAVVASRDVNSSNTIVATTTINVASALVTRSINETNVPVGLLAAAVVALPDAVPQQPVTTVVVPATITPPDCVICLMTPPAAYVLVPCGHAQFCTTCLVALGLLDAAGIPRAQTQKRCPSCRAPVTITIRYFC